MTTDHTATIGNMNKTLMKLSQTILARIMRTSSAHVSSHMGAIEMIYGVICNVL